MHCAFSCRAILVGQLEGDSHGVVGDLLGGFNHKASFYHHKLTPTCMATPSCVSRRIMPPKSISTLAQLMTTSKAPLHSVKAVLNSTNLPARKQLRAWQGRELHVCSIGRGEVSTEQAAANMVPGFNAAQDCYWSWICQKTEASKTTHRPLAPGPTCLPPGSWLQPPC